MSDNNTNQIDEEFIFSADVTDAWLEAAALTNGAAAYTQFGLCTVSLCPGNPD